MVPPELPLRIEAVGALHPAASGPFLKAAWEPVYRGRRYRLQSGRIFAALGFEDVRGAGRGGAALV